MTRSCAKPWCDYRKWGGAHMGSTYDFNLLMYFFGALRIGTRCLPGYHGSYVSNSLCPLKFVTAALFAKLASLCLPSVSLTRPLSFSLFCLSPCSCLQLLLGLVSSCAPPLKALEFYCSEKNAKACGYQRVCQET